MAPVHVFRGLERKAWYPATAQISICFKILCEITTVLHAFAQNEDYLTKQLANEEHVPVLNAVCMSPVFFLAATERTRGLCKQQTNDQRNLCER